MSLIPPLQVAALNHVKTSSQFENLVYPSEFIPAVDSFAHNIGCYPEEKKKKIIGQITDCFERHVSNVPPNSEEWVILDKAFSLIATNLSDKRSKDRQFEQAAKYVWYIQKIANRTLTHIPGEIKPKIVITPGCSKFVVPAASFNNLHLETFQHEAMMEAKEDVLILPKFEDPRSLQAVLDYLEGDKEYVTKYVDMDNIEEILEFGFVHKMERMLTDCSKYAAVLMKEGLDNPSLIDSEALLRDLFLPMYDSHDREESFPLLHILKVYFFHKNSKSLLNDQYCVASDKLEQAHKLLVSCLYPLKDCLEKDLRLSKEQIDIVNKFEGWVLFRIENYLKDFEDSPSEQKELTSHLIEDLYYPIYKRIWIRGISSENYSKFDKLMKINRSFLKINHPEFFERKRTIHLIEEEHAKTALSLHGNMNGIEQDLKIIDAYGMFSVLRTITFSVHPTRPEWSSPCKKALDYLQEFFLLGGDRKWINLKAHYNINKHKLEDITKVMDEFVKIHESKEDAFEDEWVKKRIFGFKVDYYHKDPDPA